MNAIEAKMKCIETQYNDVMEEIEDKVGTELKGCRVGGEETLYDEVAEHLSEDGFDVQVVIGRTGKYNYVSWENAEEGRNGIIEYIDETKPVVKRPKAR